MVVGVGRGISFPRRTTELTIFKCGDSVNFKLDFLIICGMGLRGRIIIYN